MPEPLLVRPPVPLSAPTKAVLAPLPPTLSVRGVPSERLILPPPASPPTLNAGMALLKSTVPLVSAIPLLTIKVLFTMAFELLRTSELLLESEVLPVKVLLLARVSVPALPTTRPPLPLMTPE